MATYSKTFLAFPDGFVQNNGQSIFLQDSLPITGIATNPQASFNSNAQSGWYRSLPKVCLSGAPATQVASLIPVAGYDEAYLMPVNASGSTAAIDIYGIWGDYQSGGDSVRWLVQLFYSTGIMTSSTAGCPMPSINGTAYRSFTGLGTPTTGMNKVLDDTIGCTTSPLAGSSTTPQVYGFPHLGGADYLAICAGGPASDTILNCYVRLG